ncbi:hypothetical protein PENSPDRAFT_690294 [Peniophora sp. CONT]|nr:hypothetical protein PENSPDRAFT_690294 [Peniophora sp. CONT]
MFVSPSRAGTPASCYTHCDAHRACTPADEGAIKQSADIVRFRDYLSTRLYSPHTAQASTRSTSSPLPAPNPDRLASEGQIRRPADGESPVTLHSVHPISGSSEAVGGERATPSQELPAPDVYPLPLNQDLALSFTQDAVTPSAQGRSWFDDMRLRRERPRSIPMPDSNPLPPVPQISASAKKRYDDSFFQEQMDIIERSRRAAMALRQHPPLFVNEDGHVFFRTRLVNFLTRRRFSTQTDTGIRWPTPTPPALGRQTLSNNRPASHGLPVPSQVQADVKAVTERDFPCVDGFYVPPLSVVQQQESLGDGEPFIRFHGKRDSAALVAALRSQHFDPLPLVGIPPRSQSASEEGYMLWLRPFGATHGVMVVTREQAYQVPEGDVCKACRKGVRISFDGCDEDAVVCAVRCVVEHRAIGVCAPCASRGTKCNTALPFQLRKALLSRDEHTLVRLKTRLTTSDDASLFYERTAGLVIDRASQISMDTRERLVTFEASPERQAIIQDLMPNGQGAQRDVDRDRIEELVASDGDLAAYLRSLCGQVSREVVYFSATLIHDRLQRAATTAREVHDLARRCLPP